MLDSLLEGLHDEIDRFCAEGSKPEFESKFQQISEYRASGLMGFDDIFVVSGSPKCWRSTPSLPGLPFDITAPFVAQVDQGFST